MPTPTLTLDTVQGSYVEITGQTGGRVVRTGIVTGLPTSGVDPADVLFLAGTATGMPGTGTPHPTRSDYLLSSIGVYGLSVDTARVELNYEPFGGGSGVSYVIEVGSSSSTYETNMLPGTRSPLVVGFTPTDTTKYELIPPSFVTMTFLRPMVRVIVTQLRTGFLDPATCATFADHQNNVNDATWMGKPKGSWLITSATASASRYSGKYQTRLEATRLGNDLWINIGVVQNQLNGKFAYEAPTGSSSGTPGEINSIKGLPYAYGTSIGNGVIRADPYPEIAFAPVFGF